MTKIASRLLSTCLVVLALCSVARAQEMTFQSWGLRGGLRLGENDFDQFVIGAQASFGDIWENVRFAPNVELGFGSDVTAVSLDPELHYVFRDEPVDDETFFYAGGGLGLHILDFDGGSDTDLKINLVGGIEKGLDGGRGLFGEFRMSLVDGTWFEFLGGINFLK